MLLYHFNSPVQPADYLASSKVQYDDWRTELATQGYCVVKGAIPTDRAISYQQAAHDWLKSFYPDKLSMTDPATWRAENLPIQSKINTFNHYSISHEKFMWDTRLELKVLEAFEKIWGTSELLVSFDALNVTFPNRTDVPRKPSWEHVDQSPFRRGLHCVQGIANLSPSGPEDGGLVVYPGSHLLYEEFFDTQVERTTWKTMDWFGYSIEQLKFFTSRGITPHKVCAEVGDLILWDSRTVHYGSEPTELSNQIRTIIYVAYTPARLASEESLRTKREVFERWAGTTHWPHDNINVRENRALFEDGTQDPLDRSEPMVKPELSDQLLRLAGALEY